MKLLLVAFAGAATAAAVRLPLRRAFVVLFGAVLLVPNALQVPGLPSMFTVTRVVLVGFVAGLAIKWRHGELAPDAFRPGRMHAVVALLALVAFVNGVAVNRLDNDVMPALSLWMYFLDQVLIVVIVVAVARTTGAWFVVRALVALAVATAGIAVWEHFSNESYAAWWFRLVGSKRSATLTVRGAQPRVHGPFQYALEYAFVGAMLLPFVTLAAARARRRVALVAPAVLVVAIFWTVSRTAPVAIAVGLIVLVVGSRFERRVSLVVAAGFAIAALVVLASPGVLDPLNGANPDSGASRVRRIALATTEVADRPYRGLGLDGAFQQGVLGTDSSATFFYATLGVPGVVMYGVAIVGAIGAAARGLRRRVDVDRALAAAALGGIFAGLVGDVATNIFFVSGASKVFWAVVAVGIVVAEGVPLAGAEPVPRSRPSPRRLLVPVGGLVAGLAVMVLTPPHVGADYRFQTMTSATHGASTSAHDQVSRVYIRTVCDLADALDRPGVHLTCIDPILLVGVGDLRIEGRSTAAVLDTEKALRAALAPAVPGFELDRARIGRGRPTWASTAPFWLTMVAILGALLVPPVSPRRRDGTPWRRAGRPARPTPLAHRVPAASS